MKHLLIQAQTDTIATADTLTKSYSDKWDAMSGLENASPVIQAVASYDLIFIVLGVALIIWFVLLFFIIRLDKKVSKLELQVSNKNQEELHEA